MALKDTDDLLPVLTRPQLSTLAGNDGLILAWIILIGMVAALIYAGLAVWRGLGGNPLPAWPPSFTIAIPIIAVIGLGVAGYLAYVELSHVNAVCGPVGDCNAVQNSPYSKLLGIPLGIVGLAGYGLILLAWWWWRQPNAPYQAQMPVVIFCAALFSVLFSIYLTSVEIFVINAVCIWCITSAVLVTLVLLISTGPMLEEFA